MPRDDFGDFGDSEVTGMMLYVLCEVPLCTCEAAAKRDGLCMCPAHAKVIDWFMRWRHLETAD